MSIRLLLVKNNIAFIKTCSNLMSYHLTNSMISDVEIHDLMRAHVIWTECRLMNLVLNVCFDFFS